MKPPTSRLDTARPERSRLEDVSRRAFLRRSGLLAGAVIMVPGLACAKSDAEVFASGTTTGGTGSPGTAAPSPVTTGQSPETTGQAPDTTTSSSAGTFPAGGEMVVDFTFEPSDSGGRVRNPYIAVWVEDQAGDLVKVLGLWYQSGRNERYLEHLSRFTDLGGTDAAGSVSGATRSAGSYSLTWDGSDLDGAPVALGDYVVTIEAAHEHGPYEIIVGPVSITGESFELELDPSDELTAAAIRLVA